MPFPKTPALKDQIVLCNLSQRNFKSAAGLGRQNDIIEGSARRDGFDRVAARMPKRRENGIGATRYTLPCLSVVINSAGISSGPHLDKRVLQLQGTLSYSQFNPKALRKLLISVAERIGFVVRATCHRSSCAFRVSPQAVAEIFCARSLDPGGGCFRKWVLRLWKLRLLFTL